MIKAGLNPPMHAENNRHALAIIQDCHTMMEVLSYRFPPFVLQVIPKNGQARGSLWDLR